MVADEVEQSGGEPRARVMVLPGTPPKSDGDRTDL